ncbi:MAG: ClbS/DfsB family four-helix bundle protein [Chloroflexi bacterium]|nr:ClbS/DfsB family four-helix bundle protein [Chloroflexota bacterium]
MPNDNHTKQDLLAEIQRERTKLVALLAPLDEAGMLVAVRDDGWTAKDILAHLTAWEQRLLRWLERWRTTGDPGRPEVGVSWDGFDALNDKDHLATKETPLPDVRRASTDAYEAVIGVLDSMTDDDLAVHPETPDGPTWSWIFSANTWEHYQEHREEIEAWGKEKSG